MHNKLCVQQVHMSYCFVTGKINWCSLSIFTILPTVSLDHFHQIIPASTRINSLRAAHFASKLRCNMCCFPSYNNIDFQPQILKRQVLVLHLVLRPFVVWLCPGTDRVSEQANYYMGGLFSHGGFLSRIVLVLELLINKEFSKFKQAFIYAVPTTRLNINEAFYKYNINAHMSV